MSFQIPLALFVKGSSFRVNTVWIPRDELRVDHIGPLLYNTKALKSYYPSSPICAFTKRHGYRGLDCRLFTI